MKLKNFIIIGYFISMIITVIAVVISVNVMLIDQHAAYFIVGIAVVASIIGFLVSFLLLQFVFSSLKKLKILIKGIPDKKFEKIHSIKTPKEFRELADVFNVMTHNLENTFKSLEESEYEKGLMIAQLSHDIKTPITSIQATVEGMLDGIIAKEEETYYLKTIRRQTDRLNKLVEELDCLTISSKNDNNTVEKRTIFLDKLLIDSLSEFQLIIDKENRNININVHPNGAKIISDYDKLSRIILNLISNAFKYSKEGTSLSIDASIKDDTLLISVEDEGLGIKKEDLNNIFKRLYRVESSRNLSTGGYGLGLYIAQELAHQLNGEIKVESEYGKGSKFSLILKL